MKLRRIFAGVCAAFALLTTSAYADYEYNAQTTTTAAQYYDAQTTTSQQTWQTTTTSPAMIYVPAPAENPTTVKLDVGEIKDNSFTAKLNIESESLISNASVSISYDKTLIECTNASFNSQAGGMPVGNDFDGKYVYNYVNQVGTDFDGVYLSLRFKIVDETMTSAVIYVTVTSLDNNNAVQIPYKASNGIINIGSNNEEPVDDTEILPAINLTYSDKLVNVDECGLSNVDRVTVEDAEILQYEDGAFKTLSAGKTKVIVQYNDGTAESYVVNVLAPETVAAVAEISSAAQTTDVQSAADTTKSHTVRNVLITVFVILAICAICAEYIVIVKPFDKKKAVKKTVKPKAETDKAEDENLQTEETLTENNTDEETAETDETAENEEVVEEQADEYYEEPAQEVDAEIVDDVEIPDEVIEQEIEETVIEEAEIVEEEQETDEEPDESTNAKKPFVPQWNVDDEYPDVEPEKELTDEERIEQALRAQGFNIPDDK